MTLIKCPSCDHTISSVASKCPRCGYLLSELRFQQGRQGSLTECRRCGRKVLSKSRVCPYCGLTAPGRRPRALLLLVVAGIAAGLALVALRDGVGSGSLPVADTVSAANPMPRVAVVTPPSPPVLTPPSLPGSTATAVPGMDSVTTAPGDSLPVAAAGDSVVTGATPADSLSGVGVSPVPTQTRWAADWANVREARSLDAPVVGMVRRGEAVQVANQAEGWWEVYRDGRFIGYVAADLLLDQPPAIP